MSKSNEQIVNLLVEAAGGCFKKLFREHKERFYYCSLIMAEDSCPFISAWSYEALERITVECESDNTVESQKMYKWSYADSPYCAYGYDEFFGEVKTLFQARRKNLTSNADWISESNLWLDSMEKTMSILDKRDVFNCTPNRNDIVINAEIMPPESSNTERAVRLNPPNALTEWIEECSEEDEDDFEEGKRLCDVIITKPVLDKKEVLKIKKAFCNEDSAVNFLKGLSNPPFKIKSSMKYTDAQMVMSNYPEFVAYIDIRKI